MKVVDTPKKKLSHRKSSHKIASITSDGPGITLASSKVPGIRISKQMKTRNASIHDIYQNVSFNKMKMINMLKKQYKVQ